MSGAYFADEGEIFVEGQKVDINSPQDALDQGLRFIYQELNLVRELDIAKNMFLGMEPMRIPLLNVVNQRKLYKQAAELLERFHIDLDPTEVVGKLSVTQQKMVEIARALTTRARVIVLDEPTDVLEDRSRQDLFQVIDQLKQGTERGLYLHLAPLRRGVRAGRPGHHPEGRQERGHLQYRGPGL
ncbi:MAG: ATP-binding cassette domain-containing protein [Anaerolineae bacterium]|nr:ATP-binding cassette domain-containing protein [Anaerolineae bacterium]